jgi:hypothetical protein
VKLIAFLTMIMFFITSIIDTDFSLSATEKSRDGVLPSSYGQELEREKQEKEVTIPNLFKMRHHRQQQESTIKCKVH